MKTYNQSRYNILQKKTKIKNLRETVRWENNELHGINDWGFEFTPKQKAYKKRVKKARINRLRKELEKENNKLKELTSFNKGLK